jgi:hypothetical protein
MFTIIVLLSLRINLNYYSKTSVLDSNILIYKINTDSYYQKMNTNLRSTFLPSLAWQLTFNGVSRAIIFSSLPLLEHKKMY